MQAGIGARFEHDALRFAFEQAAGIRWRLRPALVHAFVRRRVGHRLYRTEEDETLNACGHGRRHQRPRALHVRLAIQGIWNPSGMRHTRQVENRINAFQRP